MSKEELEHAIKAVYKETDEIHKMLAGLYARLREIEKQVKQLPKGK